MAVNAAMKILIIDDQGHMRKIIKSMLNQMGFSKIVEAEDGQKAWDLILKGIEMSEPIGFIIADFNMPKLNGLELLKQVRANETTTNIPFLMITAEAEQKKILDILKVGVDSFIIKPFSPKVLNEKMVKIFNKSVSQ